MNYVSMRMNSYGRIGHQFQCWMSAMIISEWLGYRYVHFPFERAPESMRQKHKLTEHNPLWEQHLNFGKGEIQHEDMLKRKDIQIVDVLRGQNEFPGKLLIRDGFPYKVAKEIFDQGKDNTWYYCQQANRIRLFQLPEWERQGLVPVGLRERVVERVRQKYWKCANIEGIESYFDPSKVNVAIQIRRGDQSHPSHYRFLPVSHYRTLINNIREAVPNADFHIYSESPQIGKELNSSKIHFHHCDNQYPELFKILHLMIIADVLVVARSAFSWIASHISEGVTLEEDGRMYYSSPHSVITDSKGDFDKEKFTCKLKK